MCDQLFLISQSAPCSSTVPSNFGLNPKSGPGIPFLFLILTLLLPLSQAYSQCFVGAADRTSSAAGNWSLGGGGGNWGGAATPGCDVSAANFKVEVGHNMTVFSATCPTLTFSGENSSLHVVNNSTLTVQGNFDSAGEGVCIYIASGSNLVIGGDFILNSESVNLIIEGSMTVVGDFIVANEAATINVEGSLVIGGEINCSAPCEPGSTTFTGDGTIAAGGGCTGDWGAECNTALPVKLLYFHLQQQGSEVILNWATTREENFSHFIIQRSSDGLSFDDIAERASAGKITSNIISEYSVTDETPLLGFNYYRLKAVDIDHTFEYSDVIVVKVAGPRRLAVYPNPSSGESMALKVNFNPEESDRIVIVDQLGTQLLTKSVRSSFSTLHFENKLKPGIYFLKYISKDFEQTLKISIRN